MRPILLQGHTRPLTMVRYNREGDLLFSTAKDQSPNVWFSHNGERLGTYKGHTGAVWCLDVNYDSTRLITGSADSTAKLWDVETGTAVYSIEQKTAVRSVGFALGDRTMFTVTDARMGNISQIFVYDVAQSKADQTSNPISVIDSVDSKVTCACWGPLNKYIYSGHENGDIVQWDWKTGQKVNIVKEHTNMITDMQFSEDKSYFITSSKDHTAKLFDTSSLNRLKTYQTERPVNSASISNLKEHVILGGGQEASQVTTTVARVGKFEVRFYDKVFEEEIGRVKGHFGPINTVAFAPDGKGFASGGEDGYVRLHHFDPDYFTFDIDY